MALWIPGYQRTQRKRAVYQFMRPMLGNPKLKTQISFITPNAATCGKVFPLHPAVIYALFCAFSVWHSYLHNEQL
jgi:hypothetical protein